MKKILCACLFVVAFAVTAAPARPAAAQHPGYGGFAPYDGYYLGFYNRAFIDNSNLPPYFAQFPPVYYSNNIIPRPYGWSPFALRPDQYNALPVIEEPRMFENPYFEEQVEEQSSRGGGGGILRRDADDKSAAVQPRVILNPFVVQDESEPAGRLARTGTAR